jgi:hypothetical protein
MWHFAQHTHIQNMIFNGARLHQQIARQRMTDEGRSRLEIKNQIQNSKTQPDYNST